MADLSVQDVAARLATSGRTVRRYLATGQLAGTRTVDGWTVSAANLDQFMATRTVSPATNGHVVADMSSGVTELVRLVDKLQEENRVMAGRIGWLEAQVDHLKALPPPSPERPISGDSDGLPVEPTQTSSTTPHAGPWWRFWGGR